ncbi:prostaglandin G/H synthase 2-like [Portunus trituberculatus]|uniref:prostaglandin G/H synthase 2-like n=1 Tax=Portunus trituberculatus TaxID=210409 RepID=UPI001E1D0B94|nr:prostaglandin G/H synthase 2-like [Portunus trituberculatus]
MNPITSKGRKVTRCLGATWRQSKLRKCCSTTCNAWWRRSDGCGGEVIKVTIEDLQHLGQHHLHLTFEPYLTHSTHSQYHNPIHTKVSCLLYWYPLLPNGLEVTIASYSLMDTAVSTAPIFKHGLDNFTHTIANSHMGAD